MNKALVFVLVVSTVTVSVGKSVVAADCGKSPCPVNAVPRGLQGTVALTGLDLIDSLTEKRITTLTNNQVIVVDQIPGMTTPSFNINATFVGSAVKSVVFGYGATTYRTDNFAPFSFCGNMGPLFNTCSLLGLGTHVVTATPYSFQGGGGIVGSPVTVTFTVVASAPKPPTMAPKAPTKAPSAPTPVAAPSTAVVSNYNIQLDLSKITTAADQTVFASAAAKWQSVVLIRAACRPETMVASGRLSLMTCLSARGTKPLMGHRMSLALRVQNTYATRTVCRLVES
jgi:hypothetical protein